MVKTVNIEVVPLDAIDSNPYRMELLEDRPLDNDRIESLAAHYQRHDAFPVMPVARRADNRVQLAHGHHTIEAAKRLSLSTIQIDVRQLDDRDMIGLMPTESGPHVKFDALLCIHSWMLARNLAQAGDARQATEIARLFGWTRTDKRRPNDQPRLSDLASACNAAAEVLVVPEGKTHALAELREFAGMTVHQVRTHATVCRTRKGHWDGFGRGFVPEEKRGIRRKLKDKIEVDVGLHFSDPFKFRKRPGNIGTLVRATDVLTMMIDRLLHRDSLGVDDPGPHIADLAASHHVLESEEELAQVAKIHEALNRLINRAAEWQDRLSDKPRRKRRRKPPG